MTVDQAAPAATALLDAVRALAPAITARAAEIEAARRLPADLLHDLVDAGCFRMLLPRSHGGAGIELPEAMRVLAELARADASVGWTVMIGAGSWGDIAGLPRASFDAIYASGPDVITGGAISPTGTATSAGAGYHVRGRWAFASGIQHCDWLYANCAEETGGEPAFRVAVLAAGEVEIEDTWRSAGLCGTGSHHFRADVVIPAERTYRLMVDPPCVDVPLVRIPPPALYALAIASVAVGIAQGALDEIAAVAGRTPLFAAGPLAANPWYQHQLATADTQLRAARSLVYEDAAAAWATAEAGREFTLGQRAQIRATVAWATSAAADVVGACHRAGGGGAVYLDSPLQRRLRDIHTLTQHFLVRPDTLTTAGAVLAGQEPDLPVF